MTTQANPRAAGFCFLASGLVFLAVAAAAGLRPFLGVGLGMIGIGAAFLAKPRRGG